MRGLLPQRKNPFYILASPYMLTAGMYIPIFLVYLIIPPALFEDWYSQPKLISNLWQATYLFNILILFGMGGYLGFRLLPMTKSRKMVSVVIVPGWYVRSGMIVVIFAYLAWFGLGIQRAGSIGSLFSIYLMDPFYVKSMLLKTVPGITTLTQVAVAAIPLMICRSQLARVDRMLIGVVLLLATLRAFLFLERLAILELVIPLAFLGLSSKRIKWTKVLRYVLFFIIVVISFFILNELYRSFAHKEWTSMGELVEAGVVRFLGYYTTSVNNAIFCVDNLAFAAPLYSTFQAIWRFPGLRDAYRNFAGIYPIHVPQILYQHGMNPEFNTVTAIGSWVVDFGLFGTFIVALFFGFFSGVLYRLASQNRLATAFYSVWLVGLLEFMRIFYFATTRLFPAYLFFMGPLLLPILQAKRTGSDRWLESG